MISIFLIQVKNWVLKNISNLVNQYHITYFNDYVKSFINDLN